MRDFFICLYCGRGIEYVACDGSFICDTCCYIIRADGSKDFTTMDSLDLQFYHNKRKRSMNYGFYKFCRVS